MLHLQHTGVVLLRCPKFATLGARANFDRCAILASLFRHRRRFGDDAPARVLRAKQPTGLFGFLSCAFLQNRKFRVLRDATKGAAFGNRDFL